MRTSSVVPEVATVRRRLLLGLPHRSGGVNYLQMMVTSMALGLLCDRRSGAINRTLCWSTGGSSRVASGNFWMCFLGLGAPGVQRPSMV
ncbi:unnamed protein product [Lactuca virosa]|uniref:Uncharacterized protein n=1 Tax=Lactuca virosa TaxID=75947 RepID=A0AAU9M4Z8_9ASTR|nr:unnamed protein product [Lactuca virosa]